MQNILPVKCPGANVLIWKTHSALQRCFHKCEIFPIFNLLLFGYFAKNDLTNQQQTMNPVDELFLLRQNHIKLPSSVLQPPAEVGARDILWVMSASSYAALVTTPRCRVHQSTRRRFTPFLMSTLPQLKQATWSPCQQVELRCCANIFNHGAAQAETANSLQPRSTCDIINYHFINFASGHRERQAVAQMMCWKWKWEASQREPSTGSI